MATEVIIAIIMASMALIGTVTTIITSASKNDVDVLRGIIQELKSYVEELEADKEDLQVWAEKLVCQIKDAGLEPVKFEQKKNEIKPTPRRR